AGDGQRAAVLVSELEESGAEAVAEDHGDAERGARAALRRHLDGDVADGEEQSAGDPLRDRDRAHAAADRDGRDGGGRGRGERKGDGEAGLGAHRAYALHVSAPPAMPAPIAMTVSARTRIPGRADSTIAWRNTSPLLSPMATPRRLSHSALGNRADGGPQR